MNRTTRIAHLTSVALMGLFVLVVTGDGFAQSYAGLHKWAIEQGVKGWKADSFPLLVDLFILIGELGLFALALEGHRLTRQALAWADMALPFGLASAGWGVSLAFNIGAVDGGTQQMTAAVAPVASMMGLLVLLRTVHRLIARAPVATTGPVPEFAAPFEGVATAVATPSWWPLPDLGSAGEGPDGYALWEEIEPSRDTPVPALTEAPDDGPGKEANLPLKSEPDPGLAEVVATARDRFAEVLATGAVPSVRRLRRELRIGHPKAKRVYIILAAEAAAALGATGQPVAATH
ncbi:DUF2637 domain-containing protein [Actinomadura mexicana]|uniref:DUF2637 domain-containing protein n=1 Tax=Actinomadura mexicana TaxID=134959 RepID=A0A238VLI2_9ACTN|nr:DUF2637 domain-containing protein [Actinomadura mexicana]SNR34977.1 Protein of unknown function [Actinomadura mexicana]